MYRIHKLGYNIDTKNYQSWNNIYKPRSDIMKNLNLEKYNYNQLNMKIC